MTAALFKRILYLIATVSSVAILFLTAAFPQGIWLLISALLLANITLDTTLAHRTLVMAAVGLGAVSGVFIGALLAPFVLVQGLYLAMVTGLCIYAGAKNSRFTYPFLIVNFLTILTMHGGGGVGSALDQSGAVMAGVLIALCLQIILLPYFSRDEYRRSRAQVFYRLGRLSTVIFSCLTSPEYPDFIYLFERRVHQQKIKCLHNMTLLALRREAALGVTACKVDVMQSVFEVILDIGQIRRRVTDHTVFALCTDELDSIDAAIVDVFAAFASDYSAGKLGLCMDALEVNISRLDDLFEQVVRVAAREPVVFVLFLGSLKALLQQCRQIAGLECADVVEAAA